MNLSGFRIVSVRELEEHILLRMDISPLLQPRTVTVKTVSASVISTFHRKTSCSWCSSADPKAVISEMLQGRKCVIGFLPPQTRRGPGVLTAIGWTKDKFAQSGHSSSWVLLTTRCQLIIPDSFWAKRLECWSLTLSEGKGKKSAKNYTSAKIKASSASFKQVP